MSSDLAISVRGIGKIFHVPGEERKATTLGEMISRKVRAPFSKSPLRAKFEALRDVSFDVRRGEVLGIIGPNGAGKSTLLKVLSQITPPTRGEIDVHGRVGSLLEVGTGFHPELTGRENIYLNGAILGMSRREIQQHFDSIVAFAEIQQFLDLPVKRYSSGMYVRLAFSVAAHLRSDVLIVDEVLAVGDAAFQRKCMDKMSEMAHEARRTILFVSHNMTAISALCSRAILLNRGQVEMDGSVSQVTGRYLGSKTPDRYEAPPSQAHNCGARILEAQIGKENAATFEDIDGRSPANKLTINLTVCVRTRETVEVVVSFYDHLRKPLWLFTNSLFKVPPLPRGERVQIRLEFRLPRLATPTILIDIALASPSVHPPFDLVIDALSFPLTGEETAARIGAHTQFPLICEPTCQIFADA